MSFTSLLATVVASYQMMPRNGEKVPLPKDKQGEVKPPLNSSPVPIHGENESAEDICNEVKGLCQYQAHEIFWNGANGAGTQDHLIPSQTKSVSELLNEHGVRALKVEIYPSSPRDKKKGLGRIHIRESGWLLGMGKSSHLDFLKEVADFLNKHPDEVVTISYVNHVQDWRLINRDFLKAGLVDKLFEPVEHKNWTLGKQVEEGRRLIIFFENHFKAPLGKGAKRDAARINNDRPDLYKDSWERSLVRDSSYGRQARRLGWCGALWGSAEAKNTQLNYWDTVFPREKAAQRLSQAEPLEDSLFGVMLTCKDEDNPERPLHNTVFTNHSHSGPGATLVRSLNEALVNGTSFSRAISEARKSYKDPQN